MKQRIIATILLLVTVLTMLAGCVNYAFAEESMEDYVTLNLDELMKALQSIEIEEEDFGPDEDRETIVVEEIYNTLLTALNKDTDNEKTDGKIGTNDMVKYYYYCSVVLNGKTYTFNYNMKTAVNTLATSTSTDEQKDLQKAIVAKIASDYTFNKETAREVKTSLNNEKITKDDRIVVSYTLKETNGTKTTYTDYANLEIGTTHDVFADILANENAVILGSYKANEGVKVGDKHYLNISISHIVERDGTSVDVEWENKDELTQVVYNFDPANPETHMAQETIVIPESTEENPVNITYHVYPVSYVQAPAVDAYDVIKYVLGDDITTESLPVFTENTEIKALVEALVAEYAKTAKDYESLDEITNAKTDLETERNLAKDQSIRDKIDTLAKVKNSEGTTATDAILKHVNGEKTKDDEGYKTIYDIFASKVKLSDLLPFGILGLYTYTNPADTNDSIADGTTAVTLVNAINAEHDKDATKDYDSYTKTTATIELPEGHGKKIDVADKKERYEDLVDKAQTDAVEAIITNILKVDGAEALIVEQYNASNYKTGFLAYDLIKHILLSTSATANSFSFIEDLSDYVYGNTTLDDEDRETFSTVLAELTAEFAKSADSDYDSVNTVKEKKEALEIAEEAKGSDFKSSSSYGSTLKDYKKGDETAFDALAKVYIDIHTNTVFVLKDAQANQKVASSNTTTVMGLILADVVDGSDEIKAKYAEVNLEEYVNSKEISATLTLTAAKEAYGIEKTITAAEEALADAREAAYEAAVDNLIAKLLSGVLEDTEEDSNKLSVVLADRYVENYINGKINTYNTNVRNKLAKAIYEIINNQVTINTDGASYPWDLVEEFEKTLKESYKSAFYTGTSDKTTAGTYGPAVSAEDLVAYEKYTKLYNEANEAIKSANDGVSATTTAYVDTLLIIYEMEALVTSRLEEGAEAPASYFNAENPLTALVEAYKAAKAAYDDANDANKAAKSALTKAQKALTEAETAFETVKKEGSTIFNKVWWEARKAVKDAEKAVEAATEKVEGTKKTNGTADDLDAATKALNEAKEALVAGFSTDDVADVDFVAAKKDFDSKKGTSSSDSNYYDSYSYESTQYKNALDDYNSTKATLAAKQAIVDSKGDDATDDEKAALETAKTKFNTADEAYDKAIADYLKAATAYADSALVYYAESKVVEAAAKPDYDEAVAVLEDTTDDDGNVTAEGLKTKIAKAEEFEKGTALTNVEVYGHLDAYLEHVLGYNWEAVIREQAVEAVNEQIKFYAVAKALTYWEDENGNVYEVVANGYVNEELGINVKGYKAAIEAIEAEDNRITKILEHSIKHNDEDIKDKKLQKEVKKAYEELLEATDDVFVNNKVFKEYKKDLGRSNYNYAKDQYGENNLRMYLQIENLLTYLLYTDVQENPYAMHDGEYSTRELDNGKLAYLFISYEFKAEDAE